MACGNASTRRSAPSTSRRPAWPTPRCWLSPSGRRWCPARGAVRVDLGWVRLHRVFGCGTASVGVAWGIRLLAAAEREIARRGCGRVALSAHSFQAPGFYARLGYQECGRTPAYPRARPDPLGKAPRLTRRLPVAPPISSPGSGEWRSAADGAGSAAARDLAAVATERRDAGSGQACRTARAKVAIGHRAWPINDNGKHVDLSFGAGARSSSSRPATVQIVFCRPHPVKPSAQRSSRAATRHLARLLGLP
jgi:hypothetical protein